ncbi:MAG TPA: polysaccharide deacetylase, partial [Bacillaceae bacterium]
MKMKFILSGLLVMFLLFGTYKLMNARTFQLFGGLVSEVKTDEKEVALTFDDGPNSNVDQ